MTRIEAEIEGQMHEIAFEPAGEKLRVLVDGREHVVDARAVDGFFYSLLVGQRSYEVTVEDLAQGFRVQVGTEAVEVLLLDPLRPIRQRSGTARSGQAKVRSVMPGKITAVLVRPGESVGQGQPLLVIEAMKMENELLAPFAGKVTDVLVSAGSAVEAGADLVVLE
ncbi:MAG: acetyl-CoA carboxylase biotin carboxyl carrier protein subunit [Acidobacteria bacterium]|nr:MAG: acetyl-CoA carboxylase biotin carboxyl carrier protein subunit [Acidobacteriota bacterium]